MIPEESALSVAARLFDALNRRDWQAAAELVDEADTEEWYRGCLAQYESPRQRAVDDVLRLVPGISAELEPSQLEQMRRMRELYTGIANEFAGISTREELAALTPRQALARFLQACDPTWRFDAYFRRLYDNALAPMPPCPDPPSRRREVIGLLRDDDDHSHIVYRAYWSEGPAADPADELKVAALRRTPAGWRLRRQGEIFAQAGFTVIAERATESHA
jgi:hypothetical protein